MLKHGLTIGVFESSTSTSSVSTFARFLAFAFTLVFALGLAVVFVFDLAGTARSASSQVVDSTAV